MLRKTTVLIATFFTVLALMTAFAPAPAKAEEIDAADTTAVESVEDAATPAPEEPNEDDGWVCEDGLFFYYTPEGEKLTNEWLEIDGAWYYLGSDGVSLCEDWLKYGGKWYYFNADREAINGEWLNYDGSWYYFRDNGTLLLNGWASDGDAWYYCGSNGKPVWNTWVKTDGKWYYCGSDGQPLTATRIKYKGYYYYFGANGACYAYSSESYVGSYSSMLSSCRVTPSTGPGTCAAWVTAVFKRAGLGTWNGSARDMYNMYCTSSNRSELRPGMIIAVSSCAGSYAYGHVGIYLGNGIVVHNLKGVVGTMSLSSWLSLCGGYCTPRWGWLGGVVLY